MAAGNNGKVTDNELRLMRGQGWSPAELAIHFDCRPATVERRLRRLGRGGKAMTGGGAKE